MPGLASASRCHDSWILEADLGSRRAVERAPSSSSALDVFDRVLDKGIVIDAWMRVSLGGIELVTIEAQVVVASVHTYSS